MAGSAAERATALRPVVEAARAEVARLQARAGELEQWAHGHYVNGDAEAGDKAHAELTEVRTQVAAAEARVETLVAAEQAVSRQAQRDEYVGQLAVAEEQLAATLDERDRQLAVIMPTLSAAKAAILAAEAAEAAARRVDGEAAGLRSAIAGEPATVFRSNHNRVEVLLGPSALLRSVRNAVEF
ncbi:MAG: hypothetical protein ACRDPY_16280 [Streptosporangiaceae bacterium]